MNQIVHGENLSFLRTLKDGIAQLVYVDPPFNTGHDRVHRGKSFLNWANENDPEILKLRASFSYADRFVDYQKFLMPRLEGLWRVLDKTGSLFVHLDTREVHSVKVAMDQTFGPECFMNEIIWAYDYGGRPKNRWPAKHDTILWYVKDPRSYTFNYDEIDRIPYMAPSLVGAEKAERGKTPTDVWWHTIVHTTGKERTGYPTQKPLGVMERIVRVHSNPGDLVLDCFAGSGTTGEAAAKHGREFVLVDENEQAIEVMKVRLKPWSPVLVKHVGPMPCDEEVQ